MTTPRGRGRPPAGSPDAREAILAAARARFAAAGFTGTSMRAVATDAGVDPSLVRHHFGTKQELLVASLALPVNPLEKLTEVIAGGADGVAERLVRTFVEAWDPHRDTFVALVRTQIGTENAPVPELARTVLVPLLSRVMEGPDVRERASLIASQLIGVAIMRYVVRLPGVATLPVDDLVTLYAPSLQRLADAPPTR